MQTCSMEEIDRSKSPKREKDRKSKKRKKKHKEKKKSKRSKHESATTESGDESDCDGHGTNGNDKIRRKEKHRHVPCAKQEGANREDLTVNKANPEVVHQRRAAMAPISKAEWDAEQSRIREVYDPLSGRKRLVKGSGEIIERIVSRSEHQQLNSTATRGDGAAYMAAILSRARE